MSNSTQHDSVDDTITLLWVAVFLISTGVLSLGSLFAPVRIWLIGHNVLAAGHQILIPLFDGVGLGWVQLVAIACVLGIVVTLSIGTARRRRQRVR